MEKAFKKGNDKKNTAVDQQKHEEYPNECEIQRFKNIFMIF